MLHKVSEALGYSRPYRDRFGPVAGLRLALALRDWTRPRGAVYTVRVPGLPQPVALRAGTSDSRVLRQIFVEEELGFELPARPRLIIDAGANIGLSSLFFALRYPTARVIALEIDAGNFDLLRRNVAPYPRIIARRVGLWSGPARLKVANPDAEAWSFRAAAAEPDDAAAVPAVGVADLIAEFGPLDLLKMDIEGGELDVVAADCSAWLDQVRTLAVETHDRTRPGCRAALEAAIAGRSFIESRRGEYTILRNSSSLSGLDEDGALAVAKRDLRHHRAERAV